MVYRGHCRLKPALDRQQTGFTLLELIVAITLMGLLLVVLYSGLRIGLNGWDSGERRAEATNRLRLAEEFLRRQLAQSITIFQINEQQERVVAFAGEPNEIAFVAPMLAQLGQGGLYWVQIAVNDGRLWMRWRPYPFGDANADHQKETVLLEGVSGSEWAYFGSEPDNDAEPPRWHSAWTDTAKRPLLVRLNLSLAGEAWPDLVVTLMEGPP